jgi:cytidyltransferase-like protein
MAGIAHLNEIYKKKGKDFLDKLFDSYVTINEKLDASAFGVEKNPISKKIEFFKRNTTNPISQVDRTLVRYYEAPIEHINSLGDKVLAKLPSGWRFGMEYFANSNPQELVYDKLPKNGLVLSYIHVKNSAGKMVRTIQDKEELDKWADILQVERAPIIFQGVLNDDQRIKILDFLDTPQAELEKKFKTESFVKYVISILNPKMRSTVLNKDLEKPIEGIVFRFGSDDDDVVLAKMVDPIFSQMAQNRVNETNDTPNDIYYMTLIDIANYVENLNLKKFKPKGRNFDDRYINFICDLFIKFISERGEDYKNINFSEPAYMKKKEFDLNRQMIPNQEALDLIDSADSYKKLFKIMLASLRKHKKKANNFFSQEVIRQFNGTIDKINNHLSQNLRESLNENDVPLFGEFIAQRGRPEVEDEDADTDGDSVDDSDPEMTGLKNTMDLLSADEPKEEEDVKKKSKKKGKRVNIIVGRFQPFHNGHAEMVKELNEANGLPVVIVAVHPGHNKSGNSPFTISTLRTMLGNLHKDTNDLVIGYRIVGRGFIQDIIDSLRPEFEPILWGAGPDRINDYRKQLEFNFKRNNELDLDEKFEVMETRRIISGTDVRKLVDEDKFGEFKTHVPKTVQGLYPILRNDIHNSKEPANQ